MKPLEGIRVLDLSRYISGPYCAQLLGDMGADVIKIETPKGEFVRGFEPSVNGTSFYFMVFNRNKRGVSIDMRSEKGKQILHDLIRSADVLIQNFRPGTLEKMGIGWETLQALNPRLILASISGFGQTGPMAFDPGFDAVMQAMGGLMDMTGDPNGPPYIAGSFVIDYFTSHHTADAILCAIIAREKTGRGQHIETSLLDSAASILLEAIPQDLLLGQHRTRIGNKDKNTAPVGCFCSKDGLYVYIIAAPQDHWEIIARVMGREELITDPRMLTSKGRYANADELNGYLAEWAAQYNRDDIVARLKQEGIPVAPVLSISEFIRLPQVQHNGTIINVPYTGVGEVPMQGFGAKLSETPASITCGPPNLGEHTREVLGELGYSGEDIDALYAENIVF